MFLSTETRGAGGFVLVLYATKLPLGCILEIKNGIRIITVSSFHFYLVQNNKYNIGEATVRVSM